MSLELDYEDCLVIAFFNTDEEQSIEDVARTLRLEEETVKSKISKFEEYGYMEEREGEWKPKPIGYNQAQEILIEYYGLTRLALMMTEKGFKGYKGV